MPRKQIPYSELARRLNKLWSEMTKEKERMANVMASALLDDRAATKLGDLSDSDLRRLMAILVGHIDEGLITLNAEKQARKKEAAAQPPAEQERIPLSALHEGAKDPAPSAASTDPARTLSLPVRDSGYPS